jgi:protein-tyrosine-phosphatase
MTYTILFLCPHSAAKSVLAAAYCQQLMDELELDFQAAFAGTEPDEMISPAVAELLQTEGLDITGQTPRLVTREELAAAFYVVSLGCPLDNLLPPGTTLERWDDVPPPSQNLMAARDTIRGHVERLVAELKRAARG